MVTFGCLYRSASRSAKQAETSSRREPVGRLQGCKLSGAPLDARSYTSINPLDAIGSVYLLVSQVVEERCFSILLRSMLLRNATSGGNLALPMPLMVLGVQGVE